MPSDPSPVQRVVLKHVLIDFERFERDIKTQEAEVVFGVYALNGAEQKRTGEIPIRLRGQYFPADASRAVRDGYKVLQADLLVLAEIMKVEDDPA